MEFSSVEVVKTKENFFFVEWDISGASPDDYNFEIYWSKDPASGYLAVTDENDDPVVIDGAVGPLTYTHQYRQYDFNQDRYYKVKAILKADTNDTLFSSRVYIGMYKDGIHEVMRYNEDTLYRHYHGEPCYIIKRKSFGARCPTCWSPHRGQTLRSHCDDCQGTGFVVGYYQPIEIQISFDSDPKKSDSIKEWESVYDTKRARISNYPLIRPKDLLVNLDDYKRYVVTHVETTKLPKLSESASVLSKQNYILSQLLTLEELNTDDNEYFIDVDNIPEVPISDEGNTGGTHPWFNDHRPVTTEDPLEVDDAQLVTFKYNDTDFQINAQGQLELVNSIGNLGIETFVAAQTLPDPYRVVAVNSNGKVVLGDYENISQVDRIVGIALTTAALGNNVIVQKLGKMVNVAWDWEVGKGIFFTSAGVLTQTVPDAGFWMNVAKVINPTTIEILLRLPVIRAEYIDPVSLPSSSPSESPSQSPSESPSESLSESPSESPSASPS